MYEGSTAILKMLHVYLEGELMDVDAEISLLKNTLEMEGGR